VAAALRAQDRSGGAAAAIGVSVPGLARRDGTVWAPNIHGWTRAPVARRLRETTGLPVIVESDRNASVIGETWLGAARGAADAICLVVGTGIGAGILSGGRLIRGAHELSGCAGWMVFDAPQSTRGLTNLEQRAAGPAVGAAGAVAMNRPGVTAHDVVTAARRRDPAARQVLLDAASLLGLAVANLISLFDPEVVVLGGGLGSSGEILLAPLRRTALRWAQPLAARQVRITASRLGGRAPLLGAVRLAFDLLNAQPKDS
jgi:glucokinase